MYQSNLDNRARSKPFPVRLINARSDPGIWRRCSSGFVGTGAVVRSDSEISCSDSDLAISARRFRVPIWCSVLDGVRLSFCLFAFYNRRHTVIVNQ